MIRFVINPPVIKNTGASGSPQTLRTRSYPHSCEWDGKTYMSSHHTSPLSYAARMLKEDNCPNQPWEVVWHDNPNKVIMRGPNLDWLADHVLVEGKAGIYWITWRPFSGPPSHA